MTLRRRPVIVGLIAVAVIAVAFVAAALTNPWHLTGLYPLAREGPAIAVLVFAGALLAAAGVTAAHLVGAEPSRGLSERWSRARPVLILVGAVVAVAVVFGVLPAVVLDGSFRRESAGRALAVSPDGEVSAVVSTLDTTDGPRTRIYLRSRAGLFSRESALAAAECPDDPFARGVPAESVRFTSDTTLAIPIADKPTVVVSFDKATLTPDHTIKMCATTP